MTAANSRRVLHVIAQRPEMTGSGVTLDAIVSEAGRRGWDQHVLCGMPVGEPIPPAGGLPPERLLGVRFGPGGDLPFPVPGMSDVMPYPSSVWSTLTREQVDRYRAVWRLHLRRAVETIKPDLVHVNHGWVVGALVKDVVGDLPTVMHCHGTALRQMELCPHLVRDVTAGNRRHDRFLVLHDGQAAALRLHLGAAPDRVHAVGAGYRDDIFHPPAEDNTEARRDQALFAGKLSSAKGLPWLLDAVAQLATGGRQLTLHVAGEGYGAEAATIRARMAALGKTVKVHGRLEQTALADLMRQCAVFVLPSLYEGLPLVLVEARACGCRLVATDLPGVRERLAPILGDDLALVVPPRIEQGDKPVTEDLHGFTRRLGSTLVHALEDEPVAEGDELLTPFTWRAVFARVEVVWERALRDRPPVASS